jgi:1,4-dihydroxy-2-naphthoyl-CoA hydrolase
MIWKIKPTVDMINDFGQKSMSHHLGIEIIEIGDDYLKARMPVNERTKQPLGLLHGGASCVLAETLGSVSGAFCVDHQRQTVVGLEINANHLRSARDGYVTGISKPIHIGKTTQVWDIRITNEKDELVCISRLTLAVKNI